jgi:hypothetical protein
MPKHETPASRFGVQPARSAAASVGAASAGAGLAFDSDRSLQLAATERPRRSTNAVATWNRADFIEAHCCTSDLHLATRPSSQMNPVSARPDRPNANSTITDPICISWGRGKRIHSGGVKPTRWWSNFRRPRITADKSGPVFEVRPQVHDTAQGGAGLVSDRDCAGEGLRRVRRRWPGTNGRRRTSPTWRRSRGSLQISLQSSLPAWSDEPTSSRSR